MNIPAAGFSIESFQLSRRSFLQSAAVLAVCAAGCASVSTQSRFARTMLSNPHADEYRPILRSLIGTVLPFDHPRFPSVTVQTVEAQLYSVFPIDDKERFLTLQKSLIFFNDHSLFPHLFAPIAAGEGTDDRATTSISRKEEQDAALYKRFVDPSVSSSPGFTDLTAVKQQEYLRMWGQSGFRIKRQLYRSIKSLVMIAAYSNEELWSTIGYEGPIVSR
jgi:hypothetical protein